MNLFMHCAAKQQRMQDMDGWTMKGSVCRFSIPTMYIVYTCEQSQTYNMLTPCG